MELGLVLYGGTAIGLRLGHRTSVDFDFFTERQLDRSALDSAFPFIHNATVLQEQPNSLTLELSAPPTGSGAVKVQFFGGMGFGRVGIPELTSDGVLRVASLDDLMATKVKVILQRVEFKDYFDIASLISAGVSLDKGLATAVQMYGPAFQPSESLKAITYFEGGDLYLLGRQERRTLIDAAQTVRELPQVSLVPTLAPMLGDGK